jgi:hypothetical protein
METYDSTFRTEEQLIEDVAKFNRIIATDKASVAMIAFRSQALSALRQIREARGSMPVPKREGGSGA